jgi:hypothetical protein
MRERLIACLTYHKDPGPDWSRDEFIATDIRLPSREPATIRLAKRGTQLSDRLWVPEFR